MAKTYSDDDPIVRLARALVMRGGIGEPVTLGEFEKRFEDAVMDVVNRKLVTEGLS